ncbi:hypothetical protein V8G54_037915, partial (chloroplast) [Vigna mungo]
IIYIATNIDINKPLQPLTISITITIVKRGIPTSDFHILFNFIHFFTFIFTITTNFFNFMDLFLHNSLNFHLSININHLFQHTTNLFKSSDLFLHNSFNFHLLFTHILLFTINITHLLLFTININ